MARTLLHRCPAGLRLVPGHGAHALVHPSARSPLLTFNRLNLAVHALIAPSATRRRALGTIGSAAAIKNGPSRVDGVPGLQRQRAASATWVATGVYGVHAPKSSVARKFHAVLLRPALQ
jgi:hypothetical protein